MKKILFRKLLFDCLIFFTITLFSSSLIIWVFQAVNFLDIIVEDGRNYLVYLNFSLLNFPKVISKLVPFILLCNYKLYDKLNRMYYNDSKTSGLHQLDVMKSILRSNR